MDIQLLDKVFSQYMELRKELVAAVKENNIDNVSTTHIDLIEKLRELCDIIELDNTFPPRLKSLASKLQPPLNCTFPFFTDREGNISLPDPLGRANEAELRMMIEKIIKNSLTTPFETQEERDLKIDKLIEKIENLTNIPKRKSSENREKKSKAKIVDLTEFAFWKVIFTDDKVEVFFKDKRKMIELFPEDFGKKIDGKDPETWKRLLIILGFQNAGQIEAYQLQDVNVALKGIFDTEITFFRKNDSMPFEIQIERSKIDSRAEAAKEYTLNSAHEGFKDFDNLDNPQFEAPDNPEC
jgi:hypothetical protein